MVSFYLLSIALIAGCILVTINKDVLSPAKIIYAFTFLFYFGVFLGDESPLTVAAYVCLMLVLAMCAFLDRSFIITPRESSYQIPAAKYIVLLVLMMPALLLKIKFIVDEGGVVEYIMSLAFRVVDLEGRGWIVVLFSSVQVFYVFHCFLYMLDGGRNGIKFILFALSTLIFIFMALTSGSRSSLLIPLVTILLMRHYLVKRISFYVVACCGVSILFFVAFYGAFRNDFGGTDFSEFNLNSLSIAHFYYGTNPLEIMGRSEINEPLAGATYFTIITNFIPRAFYPGKPDTGGLVFTKIYTGDQWGGLSNLAPGAFGEGIMNFGLVPGFLAGFLLVMLIAASAVYFFRKSIQYFFYGIAGLYFKGLLFVVSVNYVLVAARFSYSEFTNVFFSFFLFVVLPAGIAYLSLRVKTRI